MEPLPLDFGGPVGWPFDPFPAGAIEGSVQDRFATIATRYPDRLAISDGATSLTYDALATRVSSIAAAVAQALPGEPAPVAVLFANELRFPAAILGVMAAAHVCIPLDAGNPIERNQRIARHSGAAAIVTAGSLASEVAALFPGVPVINLDRLDGSAPPPARRPGPLDVAYVLYTSGSTGEPKGVYQNHRGLLHDSMQAINSMHISCEDRVALMNSPSLNSGLRGVFSTLLNGASLHVLPPLDLDAHTLAAELRKRAITVFRAVPTVFRRLVETLGDGERFDELRLVLLGGDRSEWSDFDLLRRGCAPGARLYIPFGSTESSTVYLQWYVDDSARAGGSRLPIGYPVPDRALALVQEDGRATTDGDIGEFVVTSRYNALGYWRAPELTAQVFTVDRDDPQSRALRTGDLGRRRADGLYEHIGRKDSVIKLHGHRIEPAEIEAALKRCTGVRDAAVMARSTANGAQQALVAYAELSPGITGLQPRHIMAMLTKRIPRHMVPSAINILDGLPRLPNQKIDRNRLRALDAANASRAATTPLDAFAKRVATVFEQVIGAKNATADDNVASLGGDSLQAIAIAVELRSRFGIAISPRKFRSTQTIGELAQWIAARSDARGAANTR